MKKFVIDVRKWPTSKRLFFLLISFLLTVFVTSVDQWSKQAIVEYFDRNSQFAGICLTSWFNICIVYNRGVSFGLFHSLPFDSSAIFAFFAVAIAFALFVWVVRSRRLMVSVSVGFIAGGAIGNAFDRIRIGSVIDFIDWHIFDYHWPSFNIADTFICIGTAIIIFYTFLNSECRSKTI
ncbi:MAG: signal peptidase II [Holosporales bacterium]|jgi:signal peptidase II|nr:signal peptidase II [Holosporales bacterium]